ncbi:tetratricopeptide repeat protein [Waddlia chondrophila]|uniref:Tetratricopeptide repeat protein n=2 Tax=Waddlia chondrophila TaxID=71667 RepID=D6YSC3_WADCW|nr:hypothetical protein [Waddlia chondrophila]ADI38968.1 conserved hypothetical protein [Waddlia chondrophila WSU 86-1044]
MKEWTSSISSLHAAMNVNSKRTLCAHLFFCLLLFCSCNPRSCSLEPRICYTPHPKYMDALPSAFSPLNEEDLRQEWGKELKIAQALAREGDLYRAITGFKRARILMPQDNKGRLLQADFCIFQAYWQGSRYCEAIEQFENTPLCSVSSSFPSFREMLIMLFDAYHRTNQLEKAHAVMLLMDKGDPESAFTLKLFSNLDQGNLNAALSYAYNTEEQEEIERFSQTYSLCAKSVRKAQTLNAILPGAGYYYVGQKKSALTSFVINTVFTASAYYFFRDGNWGAGIIATSLEFGWYFGGINGAGLAAKEWNENLYENLGQELMIRKKYFPVLMLETSF